MVPLFAPQCIAGVHTLPGVRGGPRKLRCPIVNFKQLDAVLRSGETGHRIRIRPSCGSAQVQLGGTGIVGCPGVVWGGGRMVVVAHGSGLRRGYGEMGGGGGQ